MNEKQKKFILEELIPFVLREQGNGFAMSVWMGVFEDGDEAEAEDDPAKHSREGAYFDGVLHTPPSCGTVACIGGSVQFILGQQLGIRPRSVREEEILRALGLSGDRASALFYGWDNDNDDGNWPYEFRERYRSAQTSLAKAEVAVALLREVVRTEGKCLVMNRES